MATKKTKKKAEKIENMPWEDSVDARFTSNGLFFQNLVRPGDKEAKKKTKKK